MNRETLKHANKMISVIDNLNVLKCIMHDTFPQFSGYEKEVNSASFDETTLNRLKNVIKDFVDERTGELQKEFEKL